jgi:large subunit ribosomal protein L15
MTDADNTAAPSSDVPAAPSSDVPAAPSSDVPAAPVSDGQPDEPAGGEAAEPRSTGKARAKAEPDNEPGDGQEGGSADVANDPGDSAKTPAKAPAKAAAKTRARSKATDADAAGDEDADTQALAAGAGEPAEESAPDVPTARAGLKLHHLRPAPGARKAKNRVGRGEGSKGKTAGRGTKGTKARDTVAARFEGGQMPLHRRIPKLKGFSNARFKTTYQVVNLDRLATLYPDGGEVTPDDLVARGAVRKGELVKVLGTGDVATALRVTAHAFSSSAKEKITAAGGTITEL